MHLSLCCSRMELKMDGMECNRALQMEMSLFCLSWHWYRDFVLFVVVGKQNSIVELAVAKVHHEVDLSAPSHAFCADCRAENLRNLLI